EYSTRHDITQRYLIHGHKPKREENRLVAFAEKHRITSYRSVARSVEEIKRELAGGRPVGVGVAVYYLAWYNALALMKGEITMPIMDTSGTHAEILDNYVGGHAIVLTGYQDNSEEKSEESYRPGGGFFTFRNSWGQEWAAKNDSAGYGVLPYQYLERF